MSPTIQSRIFGSRTPASRILCLALCVVSLVLSYRSTTAILDLAGVARNPTEGGSPAPGEHLSPRENKPRPAKQRAVTRLDRLRLVQSEPRDPRDRKVSSLQDVLIDRLLTVKFGTSSDARSELSKPQYLRLFLAANPGSPHSPPA
jgi:hypothetical protein